MMKQTTQNKRPEIFTVVFFLVATETNFEVFTRLNEARQYHQNKRNLEKQT